MILLQASAPPCHSPAWAAPQAPLLTLSPTEPGMAATSPGGPAFTGSPESTQDLLSKSLSRAAFDVVRH